MRKHLILCDVCGEQGDEAVFKRLYINEQLYITSDFKSDHCHDCKRKIVREFLEGGTCEQHSDLNEKIFSETPLDLGDGF